MPYRWRAVLAALAMSACSGSSVAPITTAATTPTGPNTTISIPATTSITTSPSIPTTTVIPADSPLIEWYAYDTEDLTHEGWFTQISAEEGFSAEPILVIRASDIGQWEVRSEFSQVLTISNPEVIEAIAGFVSSVTVEDYYIPETDQWRFPSFRIRIDDQWHWGWVDYIVRYQPAPVPILEYFPPTRGEDVVWLVFWGVDNGVDLGLAARETWEAGR